MVDIINILPIDKSTGNWLNASPKGVRDKQSSDKLKAPKNSLVKLA